jgi:hypothetical protein
MQMYTNSVAVQYGRWYICEPHEAHQLGFGSKSVILTP